MIHDPFDLLFSLLDGILGVEVGSNDGLNLLREHRKQRIVVRLGRGGPRPALLLFLQGRRPFALACCSPRSCGVGLLCGLRCLGLGYELRRGSMAPQDVLNAQGGTVQNLHGGGGFEEADQVLGDELDGQLGRGTAGEA